MEYSKKILQLQQIYQLTPEEVAFCMLVSCGMTKGEAYAFAFRPRTAKLATCQRLASNILAEKPGTKKLIDSYTQIIPPSQTNKQTKKQKEEEKKTLQYRSKDAVLEGLEEVLPSLRGKERADILIKIADLQQMKKEENKEDEENVHYYLPLQCYRCRLYLQNKEKEKDIKKNI